MSDVYETLRNIPDPPCVDCPNKEACSNQGLACEMFSSYVNIGYGKPGGKSVSNWKKYREFMQPTPVPSRKWYFRIFKGEAA